jgi:hypothetical protein
MLNNDFFVSAPALGRRRHPVPLWARGSRRLPSLRLQARRHAGDKTGDRYGAVDLIDASNCDIENILGIEEDNRKIQ